MCRKFDANIFVLFEQKATSNNRDLKLAGDDFCASTIDDPLLSNKMSDFNLLYKELRSKQSNDIVTLPLELRRCVVDKYQKYLEKESNLLEVKTWTRQAGHYITAGYKSRPPKKGIFRYMSPLLHQV